MADSDSSSTPSPYANSSKRKQAPSSDQPPRRSEEQAAESAREPEHADKPPRQNKSYSGQKSGYKDKGKRPQSDGNKRPFRDRGKRQSERSYSDRPDRRERFERKDDRPQRDFSDRRERFERKDDRPQRDFRDDRRSRDEGAPDRKPRQFDDPSADKRGLADDEQKLCGWNACQAVVKSRPESIVRAYIHQDREADAGDLIRFMTARKRAYRLVGDEDLGKVTQSSHHGGICLIVKHQQLQIGFETWCKKVEKRKDSLPVLVLEAIGNPHNLGAILRVAAHFDCSAVLLVGDCGQGQDDPNVMRLPASTFRTAEGGAEVIPIIQLRKPEEGLARLKQAGFTLIATSVEVGNSLYADPLPRKTAFLLGSERDGLSPLLQTAARQTVMIPGSDQVNGLNIACGAAVFLGEFRRQYPLV